MENETSTPWWRWVSAIMLARRLTVRGLALKAGLTRPTIYGWRDGSPPTRGSVASVLRGVGASDAERAAAWLAAEEVTRG